METIELDLPPLAGAFSRRLHDAGLPITPDRPAEFARALTLVRPLTRRRLYWTARGVFVSDPAQVRAFDAVFASVFGDPAPARPDAGDAPTAPAPPTSGPGPVTGRSPAPAPASTPAPPRDGDEEEGAEVEVPVAMASDEEVLAGKSFDALEPHELARLYRLMTQLELATPVRRRRRRERGPHGRDLDMRRTLRSSLRTGGDPVRLAHQHRRRSSRGGW